MILVLSMLSACKTTKLVPPGKYLLVKNKIKSGDATNNLFLDLASKIDNEKATYIKHKPNRKIMGLFKFHLGMYMFGTSVKNPWKNDSMNWRRYLRRIGEAPVILDTNEINKSQENLRNYLFSQGYYNSTISYSVTYKKKKAIVTYYINPNKAFIINNVSLAADDAEIDKILNDTLDETYLKKGKVLDVDMITKERNRLTNVLRNMGYYDFTKDVIDFELDTLKKDGNVNIIISVANKSDDERFVKKSISTINLVFQNDEETQDSQGVLVYNDLNFYFNGYPVKPYVIAKNVKVKPGDYFNQSNVELTNNKLSELPIFKFIDISFKNDSGSTNSMTMQILLKTGYRQAIIFEPQGLVSQLNRIQNYNTSNSYGVAANVGWTHRNLFRNAEQFDLSSTTRFETQLLIFNGVPQRAIQQSLNASLSIPRSAFLKPVENWKYVKSIKTNVNLSFLYEINPDYTRRILPLTYQYQIQTKRSTWFLNIGELAYSKNRLSASIDLNGRKDSAFIQRLFANNLITASGLNFLFNSKATAKGKSHFIVRYNVIEFGGNVHRIFRRIMDTEKRRDTSYQLLGVNYFQYAKSEIDARCSTQLDANNSTCLRMNVGLAFPYGNQKILPFDKLFFIGGSNSLRAWRPRTVGPGSFSDSNNNFRIDRAGDIILQGSAEYRFDIIDNVIEGALFVDGGNVWLSRTNAGTDKRKVFNPETFLSEIALNTGVGMRFDFQFFLFRLDWGWQMRNPEMDLKKRWVINSFARNKYFANYSVLNFGIGYPF